jgi:hypothetical protein
MSIKRNTVAPVLTLLVTPDSRVRFRHSLDMRWAVRVKKALRPLLHSLTV